MSSPEGGRPAPAAQAAGSSATAWDSVVALASKLGPILQVIAALSSIAAVFYAIGYLVAQDTLARTGLKGALPITGQFYIEAGADFLVDLIVAPLLAPLLFIPAFVLAWVLVPKTPLDGARPRWKAVSSWGRVAALLVIVAFSYRAALSFDSFYSSAIGLVANVRNPWAHEVIASRRALLFALMLPVACALAYLAVRTGTLLRGWRYVALAKVSVMVAAIAYAAMIPIAYGQYVYDWQMRRVAEKGAEYAGLWFVRRFQDQILFVRCAPDQDELSYEVRNVDPSKPLRIETALGNNLRQMCFRTPDEGLTPDQVIDLAGPTR